MKSAKPTQGVAMILALMLTSFLFVLGISLLYFVERDSYTSLGLQREQKVELLAQTGINYARYIEQTQGPLPSAGLPPLIIANAAAPFVYSVDDAGQEQFAIWTDVSDTANFPVHSRGMLKDSGGNLLARRELAAPSAVGGICDCSKMNLVTWDVDLP